MPPKKIVPEEDFDEGEEEEEEEDMEDEEGEEVEQRPAKVRKTMKKAKKKVLPPLPEQPLKRFEAFHQPEVIGVRDVETGEVLAQGFTDLGNAMIGAEELERLERIENAIGVLE